MTRRISPQDVLHAAKRQGVMTLIRGEFGDGVTCWCPLYVAAIDVRPRGWSEDAYHYICTALGLSSHYADAFILGVDRENTDPPLGYVSTDADALAGFEDGLATWAAVREAGLA